MKGILNILKPPGMTSQNVVTYIKRLLRIEKAGHTGTLDPGAAGVLPICIGKATRISEYLLNDIKSYRVEMELGLKSDTLDKYGKLEYIKTPDINNRMINEAFNKFMGDIEQIPPMFSAVKQKGVPLYELARQGIVVDRKIRNVHIYNLGILHINNNNILFDVVCSKGTYVRSLCSDIGKLLGSDAIMTFLLRTKTGPFEINNSITLDELKDTVINENIDDVIYPMDSALVEYSRIIIDNLTSKKVINGVGFRFSDIIKYENRNFDDKLLIYDDFKNFIGIGKRSEKGEYIKIDKVFV